MFAKRMRRVSASAIMDLIKTTAGGDYISFASGLPDPTLYPVDTIREVTDNVLARDGRAALQYGAAEGYAPLRAWVARMLGGRGIQATADNILITNGSQQALDLVARAFLDPGDEVAIESPSYLAAIQTFDSYEATYRPVSLDEEGVDPAALAAVLEGRPRMFYTLPNFQNPTGITLHPERRERVARAVAGAGAVLVEDDAYYDLRYQGSPLPPLYSLAPNPRAVYLGTLSKTIAPGIRVGYLCADADVVERLGQLKQITDLHTGSLTQRIAYQYCLRGCLEPGIRRFCEAYGARRDVMLEELERHLHGVIRWTHPAGGMFLFATLPEGRDAGELLRLAMARGVVFVPGAGFHPDGRGRNTFRLNFVSAPEEKIREGVRVLGEVVREWLGG